LIQRFGTHILLETGAGSLKNSPFWPVVIDGLNPGCFVVAHFHPGRTSPQMVDEALPPRIVANSRGSSMKTNPVLLEDSEIAAILRARI
jgi:hypothetical protein